MANWISRFFRRRRGIHVEIASFSECGPVRKENQDHILVNKRGLVFCVADGMGGGEGGGVASDIVCRAMSNALKDRMDYPARVRAVDEALHGADSDVRAYAIRARYRQMGSTATVLVVDSEEGRSAAVGNVGDSRVYRFREGELMLLTEDHTLSREMLRRRGRHGMMSVPRGKETMLDHVLTKAIGVGDSLRVDWRKVDVLEGDVFLLCSDGVHGAVGYDELKEAFSDEGGASGVLDRIRSLVVAKAGRDNYSAIVVKIGGRV